MNAARPPLAALGALALGAALPAALPALIGRSAGPEPLGWGAIVTTWLFFVLTLLSAEATRPAQLADGGWRWPPAAGLLPAALALGALGVFLRQDDLSGWLLAGALLVGLLHTAYVLSAGRGRAARLLIYALGAGAAGGALVALTQLETRFSDEEFFAAVQALLVAAEWLLLSLALAALTALRRSGETAGLESRPTQTSGEMAGLESRPTQTSQDNSISRPQRGMKIFAGTRVYTQRAGCAGAVVGALLLGLALLSLRQYQRSFYPPQAPAFAEITPAAPFLCFPAPPHDQTYAGLDVFDRLLDNVAANPLKAAPEYGMLALGRSDPAWAQQFHAALLDEARQALFAGPAHSFKYTQHEAALRAYYYPRMLAAFPGLFTDAEQAEILAWFQAINRRALTTEWVDWNYGLAFSKWPDGPYENQENGAGLLALLETHNLADPAISAQNRAYLAANPRGWAARFANTDDAYVYQIEWIANALFQAAYTGAPPNANTRLAFEWLLLQALPDGAPLRYNHPVGYPLAGPAYLGARLLDDGRYIWLAGRALDYMEANGLYAPATPGAEFPLDLTGTAPTAGDCLLYSDSGLPNQRGPLAPDKLVLRQGWAPADLYLLLNLRFSGWHRYKASNTLTLAYRQTPLVIENTAYDSYAWLPLGRSLARDKRLPRENLNGLAIERSGLSRVLYHLTGIGGPWAQDPPYYAETAAFTQTAGDTQSHTRLADWRGWRHDRLVYRFAAGPALIYDRAYGPLEKTAALTWHLAGPLAAVSPDRYRLEAAPLPFEIAWLALSAGEWTDQEFSLPGQPPAQARRFTAAGDLELLTLLLPGEWAGAEAELQTDGELRRIVLRGGPQPLELTLPPIR